MDGRERWQALQARLTAARAALEAGERDTALTEIAAALELDRDFLAAHALRDRILAMDAEPSRPAPPHPAASHLAPEKIPQAYVKFEQRARRRRVDRRLGAARAAMAQQRVKAAAAALDEVIDLDPNLPELAELTAQFDQLRRSAAAPHRGPRLAAAVVFAVAVFGASWLEDSSPILSRQIVSAAQLPAGVRLARLSLREPAIRTEGVKEGQAPPLVPTVTVTVVDETPSAVPAPAVDDAAEISQSLLDSQWTADAETGPVMFDACDPRVEGDAATAVCRAARGTWNVTLRKIGAGWKVETARAER